MFTFELWQIVILLLVFAFALRNTYNSGYEEGRVIGTNEGINTVLTTLHANNFVHVVHEGDDYKVFPVVYEEDSEDHQDD